MNPKKLQSNKFTAIMLGVALIIFSIYTLSRPQLTLTAMSLVFGVLMLLNGLSHILYFFSIEAPGQGNELSPKGSVTSSKRTCRHYLNFILGIIFSVFGIFLLFRLEFAGKLLIYIVGVWLIVDGLFGISLALKANSGKLRNSVLTLGIIIIVGGILVIVFHNAAGVLLNIIVGLSLLADGLRLLLGAILLPTVSD
ncbi:MAG: DUF308 domain-containing protein [Eubacteriales bacterium]|nr:DUF308 domain-containing protein [Eubacteriales bacterium]